MTLRAPQAIVFDLDGTLIDSRLDIAAACNHALVATGRAALPVEVVAGFVGEGARLLCARAAGLDEHDAAVAPMLDAFLAYYLAHPAEHTRWMPGALDALAALAPRPLGLCTNKPRAVVLAVLEALGAGERFACVVAGGDTPDRKPAPGPMRLAERLLGVEASRLWLVGDSPIDVAAARAVGAVAVAVEGGFSSRQELAASEPVALLNGLGGLAALVG